MSSGKPLLSQSGPLSAPQPPPIHHNRHSSLTISSLGCLRHTASISSSSSSSSIADDAQGNSSYDLKEVEEDIATTTVSRNPREGSAFWPKRKEYRSAELYSQCPRRKRKGLVSWGGVADSWFDISALEVSGVSSRASYRAQDNLNKSRRSERFLQISMQLAESIPHHDNPRLIHINDPKKTNEKDDFSGNEIRTSKYTFLNFLPKNLFVQFHRVAYLYFLAIAALNQLPPLAVFGRTVSLFPLLFVLTVTAVKDGYDDWRRHRSDRNENNREALVLKITFFAFNFS